MTHNTPYSKQPDYAFWKCAVSNIFYNDLDPAVGFALALTRQTKIASAGSCFAQHIAHYIKASGYNYWIVEQAHSILTASTALHFNYGIFSTRYGNIYTSRQLRQLIDRAFDTFKPVDDVWETADGGAFVDPFRPTVQPGGFSSIIELHQDREYHLNRVRTMFSELDVFIFTLGLTEAWCDSTDGAVYPLCPGVSGGEFTPERHRLLNLSVNDVVNDLTYFCDCMRQINTDFKMILTVSPVPLTATAENRHVLCSTTVSKAVLRLAAEQVASEQPEVQYFPSYEIITSLASRGAYFAPNLRDVTEQGVEHVMRVFFNHVINDDGSSKKHDLQSKRPISQRITLTGMQQVVDAICDEELLDITKSIPSS
jgi:hypothetical protein